MKTIHLSLIVIALILIAIACAGCSSTKSGEAGTTASAGTGTSSSSGAAVATTAASGNTCPAVIAATSWTGKWVSWGNSDPCFDGRVYMYPATADIPDPWAQRFAGDWDLPVSFTQTGCDVTGSITVGENGQITAPHGCPITLTGKVDSTGAVSGTWKAYCNIEFQATDKSTDSGVFNLNMEPSGGGFIGTIGTTDADVKAYVASSCPSANSNWAGKRA